MKNHKIISKWAAFAVLALLPALVSCAKNPPAQQQNSLIISDSSAESTFGTAETDETPGGETPSDSMKTTEPDIGSDASESTARDPLENSCETTTSSSGSNLSAAGVQLNDFFSYSGKYVEDGSDSEVKNIAAITVTNNSDKAWQLIEFDLMAGGEHYGFTMTALLPGMTLTVLEKEGKQFPVGGDAVFFEVLRSGEYAEPPDKHETLFNADIFDGIVNLTNISNRDFNNNIFIYYKNKDEKGYFGGITYRVNMGTLKKGGLVQRSSGHLMQDTSEILYITYGE